jgi:signal transduction histidine kinase
MAKEVDMQESERYAHFNEALSAVVIDHLAVHDQDVVHEARRWTSGERGIVADDPQELTSADLTNFATAALRIGAHAISATGQAQESRLLQQMLTEVGEKAADASTKAAEFTGRVVEDASAAVGKAASEAKKAIVEADERTRKELTNAVAAAKVEMNTEVRRLVGGDNPELLEKLRPVLDKFGSGLDARMTATTSELLSTVAKQFDPSDPTSPMAKHAAELGARQDKLTAQIDKNHEQIASKVDELATAMKVREAKLELAKVTPIKGDTFANQLHTMLGGIAVGLGDEYSDTSAVTGAVSRSKKGDGVVSVDGGAARVVIEVTDSAREGWAEYLDEAERNRGCAASLGIVRTPAQNARQSIRVIGARRIVMAFDPEHDDPDLLRTVVMLLRTSAIAATRRQGEHQIATAEEKIGQAIDQLGKIDEVKKTAGSIQKNATKIESACTGISAGIQRLLTDALAALTEAGSEPSVDGQPGEKQGAA